MGNKNSGRKPDQERRRQIATLREQGATLEAIGRRFGITRQAVADTLLRIRKSRARACVTSDA
jgi:DNA invertase Pin-like site-specific DNA recombinase